MTVSKDSSASLTDFYLIVFRYDRLGCSVFFTLESFVARQKQLPRLVSSMLLSLLKSFFVILLKSGEVNLVLCLSISDFNYIL